MKRSLVFLSACMFGLSATIAFAGPKSVHLNWGSQISQSQCTSGNLIINVVEKVVNDIDSGVGGNYWAQDNEVRQIQVLDEGNGTFCGNVSYEGDFTTFLGKSPSGISNVAAGVIGTFQGGYKITITGSLLQTPAWKTKGSVGTFDYGCDQSGSCSSLVSWLDQYFAPGYSDELNSWGWVYHAGNNGSWVNASSGNLGDITGGN